MTWQGLMVLMLYGAIAMGSFTISCSWTVAAFRIYRRRRYPLMSNPHFWIAAGLTTGSVALGLSSTYRTYDAFMHGALNAGSDANFLIAMMAGLLVSKIFLIYASAINGDPDHIGWHFWVFCYALLMWCLLVMVIGAGPGE